MGKYIGKRLLLMIPVVIGVAITIFTIMYFVPGDPAQIILGTSATEADLAAKRTELGLDQPYLVRLGTYLSVGVPAIREAPVQSRGTENLGPMWPEAYRSASLPDGAFFSGSVWTFSPCSRMVCKIEGFF